MDHRGVELLFPANHRAVQYEEQQRETPEGRPEERNFVRSRTGKKRRGFRAKTW